MPHKCTKCGREYKAGSTEILKGCASCGGKKFLFVKDTEINKDVLEEKSISEIADESHEDILEIIEPTNKEQVEMYDRVETIRIVSPGTYELNLEKMAQSDQRIVSVGKEGNYIIDLMSMAKDEPKKKKGWQKMSRKRRRGKSSPFTILLPIRFLSRHKARVIQVF